MIVIILLFINNNMIKGKLIFGPCGIGKSFFLSRHKKLNIEDGDVILKKAGVKNRNYYWYGINFQNDINNILKIFDEYLNKGISILYSGNPMIHKPDMIVMIDKDTRWNRLKNRKGFCPTISQFGKEETAYSTAIKNGIPYDESFQDL